MLLSNTAKVKWNSRIKKYYVEKGYIYTKIGDEFEVDVHDLTDGSNVEVDVKCDYCGKTYKKHWYNYLIENKQSTIHKDCCMDCRKHKTEESCQKKYNVSNVLKIDSIKEKVKKTNLEKYGCDNPFGNEDIKQKIRETNLEKYGTSSPTQNKEIIEKIKKTCQEKYGVDFFVETLVQIGAESPRWKGGVEHSRVERATYEYNQWRRAVYQRDNYTCQCCGTRSCKGNGSVKLNAHHILNWRDNIAERYDVNNGITLCEKCHNSFHSEYGKRDNAKEQLETFLNHYGKKIC